MNSFWKNEWILFLQDMQELGEFCLQPVEITGVGMKKENLMLKPTGAEVSQRVEEGSFWKREFDLFAQEVDSAMEFLMQPVKF